MPRLQAPTKEQSLLLPAFAALPASAIHIPGNAAEFAAARAALMAAPMLGFDTESRPVFKVGQEDNGPHLVQFATPQQAWLLQTCHAETQALVRDLLSHPGIRKSGFGLSNDRSALQGRLGLEWQNVQDLDRVFKRHGYGSSVGVRAAVAMVLGQQFHKSKRWSTSNWAARQLSSGQIHYAANDAHAAAMVQSALSAWEATQPVPGTSDRRRPEQ